MTAEEDERAHEEHIALGFRIDPVYLEGWDGQIRPLLIPVTDSGRLRIAAIFARHFHQELHYDQRPLDEDTVLGENRQVFLIGSWTALTNRPLIVGAVEVLIVQGAPIVMWAWLHPHERGHHLWSRLWSALEESFGPLYLQAPLSLTMQAFVERKAIPPERIVEVS